MWTGPKKNLIILDISQFTNINSKLSIPNIEITLTPENLEIIQNFFNSLNKNTFNGYIDNNLFDKIKNTIKILPEDSYDIFYNSKKIKQLCWNIDKSEENDKVINHSNNSTFNINKSPKKSNLIIPIESNFSFVFIITSYNNSKWVEKNLNSVIHQDYKYWRVVYIDDCSNDNTLDLVNNIVTKNNLENKFIVIKNEKNYKQAYSRYIAFKQCLDNEICCLLDGDDWLYDNTVLSKLNDLYKENDIEVTYAKFQYFENNQLGHITGHLKYPDDIKNYKNHNKWVPVHMRTGFAKLFKSIPYKYLFDHNNELLKCCTDWNEMFWVLDKSNKKHMNTGFVTYVYNKDASLTYKSSYYNAHLCEIQKNYRIELEYFLKLNQLNRYEKTKTILIFTDLDSNEEKLIKLSDSLNSDYKLIFKKKLVNYVKINIDHVLFFDFKNINNKLLNKVNEFCNHILTNNKYEDLITFDENNIKLKLLNIDKCTLLDKISNSEDSSNNSSNILSHSKFVHADIQNKLIKNKKDILIITSGLIHLVQSGGIKTAFTNLINLLNKESKNFDILMSGIGIYNKDIDLPKFFRENYNASFNTLNFSDKNKYYGPMNLFRSYKVLQYILQNNNYNTIIFHDYQGVGFYSMIARRNGLLSSRIICYCHGNHYLSFKFGNKILQNDDYFTSYMERKSVEYADDVVFVSDFNKSFYEKFGSNNVNSHIIPNYSIIHKNLQNKISIDKTKICFVSRVDLLKGIDLFIEFIIKKHNDLKEIHIIGNEVNINGIMSFSYINKKIGFLKNKLYFKPNFSSLEWIEYVKHNKLLVIYPSKGETSSLVVRELLDHNISFIASDIPAIKEQINHNDHELCLFKTNDISDLINKYNNFQQIDIRKNYTNDDHIKKWRILLNNYEIPPIQIIKDYNPFITVIIPTINRYNELMESLNSIRNQTYKNIEIIIGDDGSNEEIKNKLLLLKNNNTSVYFFNNLFKGRNCNECAKHANGEFILFFDDDDIAYSNMIEEYVKFYNNNDYDLISCFANVFEKDISNEKNRYISMAIGDCLEGNLKNHLGGKGTFMIKTSVFKQLGGYMNDTKRLKWVDKRFYTKLQLNKFKIATYPGPLYHYRKYSNNSLFYNSKDNKDHIQEEITLFDESIQNLLHKHYFNSKLDDYKLPEEPDNIDSLFLLKKNLIENF